MIEIGDNVMLDFGCTGKALCPICENVFLYDDGIGTLSCSKNHRFGVNREGYPRLTDWKPAYTVKDRIQRFFGERICKRFGWDRR